MLISDPGVQFTSNYWAEQCQMFGIRSKTTTADHPKANSMVIDGIEPSRTPISCDRYSDKNWASRLPIILLGLRARPHLDSGLSPHQQAFGMELTLPSDFASKEAEELDGVEFYEQLKKVRDGYAYPPTVHNHRDDGEASEVLRQASTQHRHPPCIRY